VTLSVQICGNQSGAKCDFVEAEGVRISAALHQALLAAHCEV